MSIDIEELLNNVNNNSHYNNKKKKQQKNVAIKNVHNKNNDMGNMRECAFLIKHFPGPEKCDLKKMDIGSLMNPLIFLQKLI